ncbi:MAG: TetR/AcrR family transcriptional regulator [Rhodococcus sp. (in: high G+C Gram-positive bacteria)]|uniref:TetR/AcrR family transcriptional regulator n=1 Tax=Rhodococcus sp. TaxID=1831 RepID=UPI003BAFE674
MTTRTAHDDWDDQAVPSMAATELLREPPATVRGARTRAALVAAARTVFERSGYLDARLTDITKEANCSTGSFYTYFDNKEQVFAAVLEVAQEDMMHPGMQRVQDTDDPYAVLEASNRAYLEAYRRNAKLMGLLEQVAHIDAAFADLRRRRAEAFIVRNARGIAELQARGIADKKLDPMLASRALSGMVSRLAYSVFVANENDGTPAEFDDVVYTLTRIWANALRFPDVT